MYHFTSCIFDYLEQTNREHYYIKQEDEIKKWNNNDDDVDKHWSINENEHIEQKLISANKF